MGKGVDVLLRYFILSHLEGKLIGGTFSGATKRWTRGRGYVCRVSPANLVWVDEIDLAVDPEEMI